MKRATTLKRFQFGSKMFGKDASYIFSDSEAKNLEAQGRIKITEDLGKGDLDVETQATFAEQQKNKEFLDLIRANAKEIMEIFGEIMEEEREADRKSFENQQQSQDKEKDDAASNGKSQKSHSSNTDADDASPDGTEDEKTDSVNDGNTSNTDDEVIKVDNSGKTLLPERFPSKDKLEAAGIKYVEDIPRDEKGLQESVPDLGERSIKAIGLKLSEIDK